MRKLMTLWPLMLVLAVGLAIGCGGDGDGSDGGSDDPIKEECGDNPWCYVDALVEIGDPDRCEDVLQYWDDQDGGMVGECYFQIAQNTGDCDLCERIEKADLRDSCREYVCD